MAICVQVVNGQVQQIQGDALDCAGYLLVTKDEWALSHSLPPLSLQDGAMIGLAIISVWAMAWVFRPLGRVIETGAFDRE